MYRPAKIFQLIGLGVVVLAFVLGVQYFFRKDGRDPMYSQASNDGFELLSPAFKEGEPIPVQYTCRGENINPPLNIIGKPDKTKTFVLIMHDPDAVSGDFLHWLMWDIPASTDSISTTNVPVGAVQGRNNAGQAGYTGPCPPAGTGTHRYIFELYALDTALSLDASSSRDDLENALENHILSEDRLMGTFKAD